MGTSNPVNWVTTVKYREKGEWVCGGIAAIAIGGSADGGSLAQNLAGDVHCLN
jgi:hypothetical protein